MTARIVYPYVTEFPDALASIAGYRVEMARLDPTDSEAYWRLMAALWHSGDDFCLVEQDMVVPEGGLARLEACPEEWCGIPYWLYSSWGVWHGVTRYRASLTARFPDIPEQIETRRWASLDSAWINHLRLHGLEEAHWHWPPARHLNPRREPRQPAAVNCGSCQADVTRHPSPDSTCWRCGQQLRSSLRTMTDTVL